MSHLADVVRMYVTIYVCMYVSRLRMQLFRASRAFRNVRMAGGHMISWSLRVGIQPHRCNWDQWTKRLMETAAKTIDKDGKEKAVENVSRPAP